MGYSGSGKSTLAKQLALYYDIPLLYLDRVHFLPDWVERDPQNASQIVDDFMTRNNSWVIDGNYRKYEEERRLREADWIILLLLPRRTCLKRAILRYFRNRSQTRESMAAGCAEKIDWEFLRWILFDGRTSEITTHYHEILADNREKTIVIKD